MKFIGLLLLVGFVVVYWQWVLAVLVLWAVVRAVPVAWGELQQEREARRVRAEGLRARADREHQQVMSGDERGVYGRFPPADTATCTRFVPSLRNA